LSVSDYTLSDGNSGNNYAVTLATAYGTITPKNLSVSGLIANNKVYDATTAAPLSGSAVVSPISGDAVTLGGTAAGMFSDKNVGIDKAVKVTGVTISGADAGNYSLLQQGSLKADISKATLSVSGLIANNKVYDGTTTAPLTGRAVVSQFSGDAVSVGGIAAGAFSDKNVGTDKVVTVTGVTIGGADAGNYNLLQQGGLKADISKATLSVSGLIASDKIFDGNIQATLNTASAFFIGLYGTDIVSLGIGSGQFADPNVGRGKPVAVTSLALSGADAGNYSIASFPTNLTANITALPFIEPIERLPVAPGIDYTQPDSKLVILPEDFRFNPLSITLTHASFLYPNFLFPSIPLLGTTGVLDAPFQQLSLQQVSTTFAASEQMAMQETAFKLGLETGGDDAPPTLSDLQTTLRQVNGAVRRRVSGAAR
jgi:hypothetical protein